MVVPWLKDGWEQPIIVLCPAGQDEVAPGIVGVLFGFIIAELQGCVAYAMMQTHPHQIVAGVKVIWICLHPLHSRWGIPGNKGALWGHPWNPQSC